MDLLTYAANSESVISHIISILKEIQQDSEEEDMDYEDLISNIWRLWRKALIGGLRPDAYL